MSRASEVQGWREGGGSRIWTRGWIPARKPAAAIVLVHGIGEHTGRYDHVGAGLAAKGYVVLSFDLPGHGRSDGRRGHIRSYEVVMEEIEARIADARCRYPGVPVFVYGHSLGGNLALTFALAARKPDLAGIVASSPGLTPATPVAPVKLALGKLLYHLAPAFTMSNGLPPGGLSHDDAVHARMKADPLCHDRVSTRLGLDLLEAGRRILEHKGAFPVPLLLMQGTDDRLVDPGAVSSFAAGLTGDVTLKLWDGLYHELHNEPDWPRILAYVLRWLEKRRKAPEGARPRPSGPGKRRASSSKPRRGR